VTPFEIVQLVLRVALAAAVPCQGGGSDGGTRDEGAR